MSLQQSVYRHCCYPSLPQRIPIYKVRKDYHRDLTLPTPTPSRNLLHNLHAVIAKSTRSFYDVCRLDCVQPLLVPLSVVNLLVFHMTGHPIYIALQKHTSLVTASSHDIMEKAVLISGRGGRGGERGEEKLGSRGGQSRRGGMQFINLTNLLSHLSPGKSVDSEGV